MAHVHWLFSFSFHQGLVWDICITIAHTTGRQALKHFILVRTALLLRYISYEHDITSARASKHGRTFWVVYQRHFHTNLAIPYTHCSHWFLLRGVAVDPELVRTRFLFLFRYTAGNFVSSLFGSGLQFCFLLFLLVFGHHYARGTSARGKLFCCNGRFSGAF
jgi:hypothetical protein